MGSGLELVRMTFYVFFPVGLFYYFNRPSVYRKLLEEKKDVFYPAGHHPPRGAEENTAEFQRIREKRRHKGKGHIQTNAPENHSS